MSPFLAASCRRWLPGSLLVAVVLSGSFPAEAADPKPSVSVAASTVNPVQPRPAVTGPSASFDTFRIIVERNIFDPNRIGRTAGTAENQPPRGDMISLVGTMRYEKGLFAFFDGSNASFQKALHEGESIAQYTVTRIGSDGVELTRDGQKFSLTVGQQLRRPVGGDWTVAALETVQRETDTAPAADATPSPAIPAGASDTLKRLMEQRQKQLKP